MVSDAPLVLAGRDLPLEWFLRSLSVGRPATSGHTEEHQSDQSECSGVA
jgi:hypothetical protein